MSRFLATTAIVNAIIMTTGTVDGFTVLHACLEGFLLVELYRTEKREKREETT